MQMLFAIYHNGTPIGVLPEAEFPKAAADAELDFGDIINAWVLYTQRTANDQLKSVFLAFPDIVSRLGGLGLTVSLAPEGTINIAPRLGTANVNGHTYVITAIDDRGTHVTLTGQAEGQYEQQCATISANTAVKLNNTRVMEFVKRVVGSGLEALSPINGAPESATPNHSQKSPPVVFADRERVVDPSDHVAAARSQLASTLLNRVVGIHGK